MDESFDQYSQSMQIALLSKICRTLITFCVDENTAQTLEKHYPKNSYQTLINLPSNQFFVSAIMDTKREHQILETLNYTNGPHNPEKIIHHSLEKHGHKTDIEYLIWQKNQTLQQEFINKPITPSEWETLLSIRQRNKTTERKTLEKTILYNNPTNTNPDGTKIELTNQTSAKPFLENNVYFEDNHVELSFKELEKEKIILKLANNGWYFRLKIHKRTKIHHRKTQHQNQNQQQLTTHQIHIITKTILTTSNNQNTNQLSSGSS